MTLRQLGFIDKPIVLVDVDGYWQPFMRLFEQIVDEAFAEKDATSLVEVAGSVEGALGVLAVGGASLKP
jgi:predicted Rossmann-fold nucleotide-binding protein